MFELSGGSRGSPEREGTLSPDGVGGYHFLEVKSELKSVLG